MTTALDIKNNLIGLTLEEAEAYVSSLYLYFGNKKEYGYILIKRKDDDRSFAWEEGHRPTRFGVELENNIIVKSSWG